MSHMAIIEWWCDLSRKQKYLFSGILIAISTVILLTTGRIWFYGWIAGGILALCTMIVVADNETD